MKKITINDVAREAGVSKTTISRFLNQNYNNMSEQTKNRIEKVIQDLNYRPNKQAQSLKSKHSFLIGVVVADISNMFSSLLLKGIGTILEQKGYQMIIMDAANSISKEKVLLERLLDQNVDAIILQPSSSYTSTYQFLVDRSLPVLLVDRDTIPKQWSSILTNNEDATYTLAEEIERKGYEHIIVVSEPLNEVRTRASRYRVFEEYTKQSEQTLSLVELTRQSEVDSYLNGLLPLNKKTVLFASNGRMLMQCLQWLIQNNVSIPTTIGITGFDDWNITELIGPGITSIEQPSYELGKTAAQLLLEEINEKEKMQQVIVPSNIRWRHSL